jgi:hypothetical protein
LAVLQPTTSPAICGPIEAWMSPASVSALGPINNESKAMVKITIYFYCIKQFFCYIMEVLGIYQHTQQGDMQRKFGMAGRYSAVS